MPDPNTILAFEAKAAIDAFLAEPTREAAWPELARRLLPDLPADAGPDDLARHARAADWVRLVARGHLDKKLGARDPRFADAMAALEERAGAVAPAMTAAVTRPPLPHVDSNLGDTTLGRAGGSPSASIGIPDAMLLPAQSSPPDPADTTQGGFDDPNWVNPGRTDSELAFFERLRRQHFVKNGAIAPVLWAKPVAAELPGIVAKAASRQGRAVPPTRKPRGYRRKGDPRFTRDADLKQSIDRNGIAKILFLAEAIDRKTKAKGQRNGILGATGVAILRALLKVARHYNGICFPSYDKIREITGLALQTIADALSRLQASGFLTVINRIVRVERQVESPLTGKPMTILAVEQTSNAYLFRLPGLAAAALGVDWKELVRCGLPPDAQISLGLQGNSTEPRANPIYTSKEERDTALHTLKLQAGGLRMAA